MNKLLIHTTWMILKTIMLHERSQTLKTEYYILKFMTFNKRQNYSDRKKISDCQGQRLGKDIEYQGPEENCWSDENVLYNNCDVGGYITGYICY